MAQQKSGWARPAAVLAVIGAIGLSGPASARQEQAAGSLSDRAMHLLREQKWEEAAAVAEEAAGAAGADAEERGAAWLFLAVARFRLDDREAAHRAMDRLASVLSEVAADHWLHREAATVSGEMEGRTREEAIKAFEAARKAAAPAPAEMRDISDLGVAMWSMRYANSIGDWARAAAIGEAVLERGGNRPETEAEALLHAYFANRRLGDTERAESALERFRAAETDLPDGHTLPVQMRLLRESLGDGDAGGAELTPFTPGPDPFWRTGDPAAVGMDTALLREHERMCQRSGADAVLVARYGTIVSEWYSALYREPVPTMSSVKSITGLLAGLLVQDGKLRVDDPVGKYVHGWNEGLAAKATVRHLLTMTAGLPKRRDMGVASAGPAGYNAYVAALRPEWEPGLKWAYSNEGAQLLSPVLEAAAGEELWRYAQRRLFAPMGLRNTALRRDGAGGTSTYADAETTLREMAKFGVLTLNRGRWNGEQAVPASWVGEMVAPSAQQRGYGYLWWLYEDPKVWAMEGYLETSVWVFPDLGVVVCRVQSTPYLHAAEAYDKRKMFDLIVRATAPRE